MPEPAPPSAPILDPMRTRLWWGIFAGAWTVLAIFFALQARLGASMRGELRPWSESWIIGALDAYTWGLLALAAFWLARWIPLESGRWGRILGLHLAVALILVPVRLEFFSLVGPVLIPTATPSYLTAVNRLIIAFPTNLMVYLMLVGVGYTLEYFRRYRDRELAASRLEAQVANAHLQVLTTQLQPHFLFATLRTVSGLMHSDVRAADRTLALLGDLLRSMLQRGVRQTASLREEVEFLELYLEIEQLRFGDRLRVEWEVAPEVLDACVPHLVLQPLVENFIRNAKHGGVAILAWAEADRLEMEIRGADPEAEPGDSPPLAVQPNHRRSRLDARVEPALAAPQAPGGDSDLELRNARSRLAQIYGADHCFQVEALPTGAHRIRVSIPLRLESRAPKAAGSRAVVGATA
jgi:two-component system, LytTR family, sensor kinase